MLSCFKVGQAGIVPRASGLKGLLNFKIRGEKHFKNVKEIIMQTPNLYSYIAKIGILCRNSCYTYHVVTCIWTGHING